MFQLFKRKSYQIYGLEAEQWFGKADVVQTLSNEIFFKEWISVTEHEILQIYYNCSSEWVSLKIIQKSTSVMVNDLVPWGMEFTERQALDHLVQMNPKSFLSFHPDINNLSFNNQDLY